MLNPNPGIKNNIKKILKLFILKIKDNVMVTSYWFHYFKKNGCGANLK